MTIIVNRRCEDNECPKSEFERFEYNIWIIIINYLTGRYLV